MALRLAGVFVAATVLSVAFAGIASAELGDISCSDFDSQAEAQEFFDATNDAQSLDADNDGIACENLPGPYSSNYRPDQPNEAAAMPSTGSDGSLSSANISSVTALLLAGTAMVGSGLVLGGYTFRRASRSGRSGGSKGIS